MATFVSAAVTPDALLLPAVGPRLLADGPRRAARGAAPARTSLALLAVALARARGQAGQRSRSWPGVVWALAVGAAAAGAARRSRVPLAAAAVGCVAAALIVPGGAAPVRELPVAVLLARRRPGRRRSRSCRRGRCATSGWRATVGRLRLAGGALPVVGLRGRGRARGASCSCSRCGACAPRRDGVLVVVLGLPAARAARRPAPDGGRGSSCATRAASPRAATCCRCCRSPALAAGAALGSVPARVRGAALGAGLGLLVAAQLASLAIVAGRFYA